MQLSSESCLHIIELSFIYTSPKYMLTNQPVITILSSSTQLITHTHHFFGKLIFPKLTLIISPNWHEITLINSDSQLDDSNIDS